MMIGPMKKKVITSVFVTALILILTFTIVSVLYVKSTNEQIAELKKKSEVVQRYVFTRDMLVGEVIAPGDVVLVDVKNESAPEDSYENMMLKGKNVIARSDLIDDVRANEDLYEQIASLYGRRLQVNAKTSTIVTGSLFFPEDKAPEKDTRLQEFNMITLPSDLDVGDYIDIRLRFPTGEDYSVLVAKKIYAFGSTTDSNTIFLRLNEEEIARMGSAIIESYIRDGIYLYANKYITPHTQLYDYAYVDYVEKYENARTYITEVDITSGENESGEPIAVYAKGDEVEREFSEIVNLVGLSEKDVKIIADAYANEDEDVLDEYRNKLVTTEKSIVANYPVKKEVAVLLAKNPNVIEEIRNKYNEKIDSLEEERANFLDTNLTEYDDEGNLVIKDDYIQKISENLKTEIQIQKTERKEYLLKLLDSSSNAN